MICPFCQADIPAGEIHYCSGGCLPSPGEAMRYEVCLCDACGKKMDMMDKFVMAAKTFDFCPICYDALATVFTDKLIELVKKNKKL